MRAKNKPVFLKIRIFWFGRFLW